MEEVVEVVVDEVFDVFLQRHTVVPPRLAQTVQFVIFVCDVVLVVEEVLDDVDEGGDGGGAGGAGGAGGDGGRHVAILLPQCLVTDVLECTLCDRRQWHLDELLRTCTRCGILCAGLMRR